MSNKIYNQEKLYGNSYALNIFDGTKVGAIILYSGDDVPSGFLECNGSDISRTDYKALFDAIGTKFGDGDGSTTFTLPNIADATDPKIHYLIKWNVEGSMMNYATTESSGFVRFATDEEARYSVREDLAINARQLKLAVQKTDLRNKIYGTDENGRQTHYNTNDFFPIGSIAFGVKPEIGEWEEVVPQGKYQHNIALYDRDSLMQFITLVNNDGTQLDTLAKVCKALYDAGHISVRTAIQSSGHNEAAMNYSGAYSPNGTQIYAYKIASKTWAVSTWTGVDDTVRTLIDYNIYKRIA